MPRMPRPPLPFPVSLETEPAFAEVTARMACPERPAAPTEAETALEVVAPGSTTDKGYAQPWAPQPGETAQEYEAFRLWLDSGLDRPNVSVAKRWAWRERKVAYDLAFGAVSLGGPEVARDKFARLVHSGLDLLAHELAKLLAQTAGNAHPSMTPKEVVSGAKTLLLMHRLLYGESTANVSVKVGEADPFDNMTDEEFALVAGIKMAAEARAKGA